MGDNSFLASAQTEALRLTEAVADVPGDWIFRHYIETFRCMLAISINRGVVGQVLEQLLLSGVQAMARREGYSVVQARERESYPDLSFISNTSGERYAVSLRSTYLAGKDVVDGMALTSFAGYFRNRESRRGITFPYNAYNQHIIMGAIFSLQDEVAEESVRYLLSDLAEARALISDVFFFAQPSYRIASDQPEKGNTRRIGSVVQIEQLLNGSGPFATLGEDYFDDYWRHYPATGLARASEKKRPYGDLQSYARYKSAINK